MAENDTQAGVDVETDEFAEPEFDRLMGVVTDGVVGAIGGLVGTAAMTVVLLGGASVGVFDVSRFAWLGELTYVDTLFPANPVAVGYFMFLLGGMITFPLLLASIGSYLPGDRFATKGLSFGFVLWTGFANVFYTGQAGMALWLYLGVTLLAHFVYGFSLGSVFDYLSTRPDTLV